MKRSSNAFAGALLSASLAMVLPGCGGGGAGGGGDSSAMAPPVPSAATSAPADAFTASMAALVRSAPETTEPDDVDGAALAKPDDREPLAVE